MRRLEWSIELFKSRVPFVLDSTTLKVIPVYSADLYVTMVTFHSFERRTLQNVENFYFQGDEYLVERI